MVWCLRLYLVPISQKYKSMYFRLTLFLALFVLGPGLSAQVIINEYSASNLRDFPDNYDRYEDWIELHNPTNSAINIGGYHLSDKANKPKKWEIPAGTIIPAQGFLVFWASGRDEASDGHYHTNFKFTQTDGDEFVLFSTPNGTILEVSPLIITQLSHSVGKAPQVGSSWRICTVPTPGSDNLAEEQYLGYAPKPNITTEPGFYAGQVTVTIAEQPGYEIRYTTDGNLPMTTSPLYTEPLVLQQTQVLKARCFSADPDILPGLADFKTFFINESSLLPIYSVGADSVIELAEGDRSKQPIGSIEVFTSTGQRTSTSYGELDRHGQDSWVNDQRSLDWISRDEMGYSSAIHQQLFTYSDRDEYQRIILRASGDDNYPAVDDPAHEGSTHIRDEYVHTLVQTGNMHLDARSVERCIVFLNGRYWGVYAAREKPDDHDYTQYTYDQDKYDLQYLKTWGGSWSEYGGYEAQNDWVAFRDRILDQEVSSPAAYQYITDRLDVISLMDYMIANLSVVSSDWLNYNTGWWRGTKPSGGHKKWGYIMWDNDATFDYYINYSGVPDISPDAQACDIEDIGNYMDQFFVSDTTLVTDDFGSYYLYPDLGKHEKIFLKLLNENENFRNQYFSRYADMISTTFSCDNMLNILDSMVQIIKPSMTRHISRWGGSVLEWRSNVERLQDFVTLRCGRIGNGLVECYDLAGPYEVTLAAEPAGWGAIKWNTLTHTALPWQGTYFGNMTNEAQAIPVGEQSEFSHWRSSAGTTLIADPTDPLTTFTLNGPDSLIAVFTTVVGTHEVATQALKLWPNPATDAVTLITPFPEGAVMHYRITSSTGALVKSGYLNNSSTGNTISTENLPAGVYTVDYQNNEYRALSKLVLIR